MAAFEMESTITALLAEGKGILAADESLPTMGKRLEALHIPSTEETRRAYRELLITTPGLGKSISGVILFDETVRQRIGGLPAPAALSQQGIIPGVKVDRGTAELPGFPAEKYTQGLDGLAGRLAEYRELGARFTKWRAVFSIAQGLPTAACVGEGAHGLALFAALSQAAGLVPVVEPEVLMDGDHAIGRCEEAMDAVLRAVFASLSEHRVKLEAMLLKTGMVLPGKAHPREADPGVVAEATIRCLRRAVPAAVPGIVFLSGGQGAVAATQRLNALCGAGRVPWTLSFSFGRALQDAALSAWMGSPAKAPAAQEALLHRAACNSLALRAAYSDQAERGPAPA